jgi:hypothetical protein
MRRTLTTLGAGAMLIGLPLAALAHDDDRGWRGHDRHGHYYQAKPKHVHKHYYAPPVVYRPAPPVVYYPAPARVVERPVYVPVAPPAPRPWPFNHVDVGFRFFF